MKTLKNQKISVAGIVVLLILFISVLALSGCRKDYNYVQPAPPPPTDQVSFKKDIQPIFTATCIMSGCHDGSLELDLRVGFAYASLMNAGSIDTVKAENSDLYKMITDKPDDPEFMPKDGKPLSSDETGKILAWIKQGAHNN